MREMFLDGWKSKLKKLAVPFLLWVASGCIAELLAVLILFLSSGTAASGSDFYSLLSAAHAEFEEELLIFRNVAVLPLFIVMHRKDSARIRADLPEFSRILERKNFFSDEKRLRVADARQLLFLLPGAFYALAANMILSLVGLTGSSASSAEATALTPGAVALTLTFELLAAPVLEELLCRGLLYRRLRTYAGVLVSALVSAALFALFHFDAVQSIYAFFFGLVLTDLYEMSGSLLAVILAHVAANAVSVLAELVPGFGDLLLSARVPVAILSGLLLAASLFLLGRLVGRRTSDVIPGAEDTEKTD